jgi:hypothetical protein
MRTVALVLACLAFGGQARRVQTSFDAGSSLDDPLMQSLEILRDPEAMAQITELMQDPLFQEEVRQAIANPMVAGLSSSMVADPQAISAQMEVLMQDPEFLEKAKQIGKAMEQLMQDPAFKEQANRMAEDMMAGMMQQSQSNALATMLLAMNPAAVRTAPALARSPSRLSTNLMEEKDGKAVAIGAAALGGALGVVLTGELTTAALFASAAAYATTLDNGLGSATKNAGGLAAKAYDKTLELNEQYDVLPKVKSAADTAVNVADNLNKNYGLTDKIDEKLKLSATVDKVTDKIEEVKDSVTSKVDEVTTKAAKADKSDD